MSNGATGTSSLPLVRFRLIPRDNGFYPLFERQAATAVDTAIQLEKLMASLAGRV